MNSNCRKFILLVLVFFTMASAIASDLRIRGQIKGLTSSDRKTVPVVLSKVRITILLEGKVVEAQTNLAGVYIIDLKRDNRYLMTISRDGYNPKSIWINTKNMPRLAGNERIELTDLDFLLLKKEAFPNDISPKEDIGQLFFDQNKMTFSVSINKDYRQGKVQKDNSLRLLHKTITYLGDVEKLKKKEERKKLATSNSSKSEDQKSTEEFIKDVKKVIPRIESKIFETMSTFEEKEDLSSDDIAGRRKLIDSVRSELELMKENALTAQDSLNIAQLESKLMLLEMDLKLAEKTIIHQEDQIAILDRLNSFYIISSVLLLLILGIIFWSYRDKIRLNKELAEKNQMIVDGINYANTIQKSFLKSEEEIRNILPNFSMFFRPRDIVSGDFYWVTKIGSKMLIAAIDCTGHGVPGAFISMIANTLLNEIVNNRKILDPGKILEELHLGVLNVLKQDAGGRQSQDGMDMSLLVVDQGLKRMQFAGAKNHLFRINKNEVEVVKADLNSIGGRALRSKDGFEKHFATKEVTYDSDSTYFLFSDGYMDQFGGPHDKKFNLQNFKDLLIKCANLNTEGQEQMLQESFDAWKGNADQLDDVLVMGLKFD